MTVDAPETPKPETPPATGDKDWQAEAEKWKSLSRKNEETAKANATAAKRLEELEHANASEQEKAVRKAVSEALSAVQEKTNARLLTAEARALAAEAKFRNPGLAVKAIDLSTVAVSEDGTVDAKAVRSLLADLAKDEPYLVDDGKPKPKPDDAQGRVQPPVSKSEQGMEQARKRFGATK